MKWLVGIMLSIAGFSAQAQAPYVGGEGDGYASTSLSISESEPSDLQFDIARTEVASETVFELRISGLATPGTVVAFDATGRRVQQWNLDAPQEIRLEVNTTQWASGTYVFRLEANGDNFARKVIHYSSGGN